MMRLVVHVTHMREMSNAYRKSEQKRPFVRSKPKWQIDTN
jgi:hypothetical protein